MFQGSLSLVRDRRDLMRQKNVTLQEPHPFQSLLKAMKIAPPQVPHEQESKTNHIASLAPPSNE